MNVLSLFDGISCGRLALERVGFHVENYYASEIEEVSIRISKKNWDDITYIGDVTKINYQLLPNIDLLIGGSPCQNFSFAGNQKGMSTKDNVVVTSLEQYLRLKSEKFEFEGQSFLFWEFVNALKTTSPKYFLLENVVMSKKWEDIITDVLGVTPIVINSSLVSAQDRKRLYWTNIPNVTQPAEKNIYLDDIVEQRSDFKYLPSSRLDYNNYDKTKVDKSVFKNTSIQIGNSRRFKNAVRSNGKAFTLRKTNPNGVLCECGKIRHFTPVEVERLQTLPDNYTLIDGIKDKERYSVCGNGWTVDVIAYILSEIPMSNN